MRDPDEPIRWNQWVRFQPVQFEHESRPLPRAVRLCCPSARAGDPVRVSKNERVIEGVIKELRSSVLIVKRVRFVSDDAGP
jgi:hypothetical protein